MAYKLGKLPAVFDDRTLRFAAYLAPGLPPPPAAVDYGSRVPVWPMYDNDRYGDCTCAAAGHMVQNWTANAGTEMTPSDAAVLRLYEHFVGTPPPPDAGCNMLAVLKYWRRSGLGSDKILAFTTVESANQDQVKTAIYMFGSVYIGVALPDSVLQGDPLAAPWVVPAGGATGTAAPNPNNGHCIPAVAYDADNLYVITWGARKAMGWAFLAAYAEESYAVLSRDFIDGAGKTTAGFDLSTLQGDLAKFN
jgi:hypothetical protein